MLCRSKLNGSGYSRAAIPDLAKLVPAGWRACQSHTGTNGKLTKLNCKSCLSPWLCGFGTFNWFYAFKPTYRARKKQYHITRERFHEKISFLYLRYHFFTGGLFSFSQQYKICQYVRCNRWIRSVIIYMGRRRHSCAAPKSVQNGFYRIAKCFGRCNFSKRKSDRDAVYV